MQQFRNQSKTPKIQFTVTNDKKRQIHTLEKLQLEKNTIACFVKPTVKNSNVFSQLRSFD